MEARDKQRGAQVANSKAARYKLLDAARGITHDYKDAVADAGLDDMFKYYDVVTETATKESKGRVIPDNARLSTGDVITCNSAIMVVETMGMYVTYSQHPLISL